MKFTMNFSESDIINILYAIDRICDDFQSQMCDDTQRNVRVLCEIKLGEYENLRRNFETLLEPTD